MEKLSNDTPEIFWKHPLKTSGRIYEDFCIEIFVDVTGILTVVFSGGNPTETLWRITGQSTLPVIRGTLWGNPVKNCWESLGRLIETIFRGIPGVILGRTQGVEISIEVPKRFFAVELKQSFENLDY